MARRPEPLLHVGVINLKENSMEQKNIVYDFPNADAVKKAYLWFVQNGGLFIHTESDFELGEQVKLAVTFPNDPVAMELTGKVVWVTPDPSKIMWISTSNTSGENMSPGVGVQITGQAVENFQKKIHDLGANDPTARIESDTL